jgi:hypothetical protein
MPKRTRHAHSRERRSIPPRSREDAHLWVADPNELSDEKILEIATEDDSSQVPPSRNGSCSTRAFPADFPSGGDEQMKIRALVMSAMTFGLVVLGSGIAQAAIKAQAGLVSS